MQQALHSSSRNHKNSAIIAPKEAIIAILDATQDLQPALCSQLLKALEDSSHNRKSPRHLSSLRLKERKKEWEESMPPHDCSLPRVQSPLVSNTAAPGSSLTSNVTDTRKALGKVTNRPRGLPPSGKSSGSRRMSVPSYPRSRDPSPMLGGSPMNSSSVGRWALG